MAMLRRNLITEKQAASILLDKHDIVRLFELSEYQAKMTIRNVKLALVKKGYNYYSNPKVGKVPAHAITTYLGL